MKWGTATPARPAYGTRRTVRRQTFCPTRMSDGTWAWFEPFSETQEYVRDIGNGDMMEGGDPGWVVVHRAPVATTQPSVARSSAPTPQEGTPNGT